MTRLQILRRGVDRPPAVAGRFYPDDPLALEALVDALVAQARAHVPGGEDVRIVLCPHAGYAYSGPTAGAAFAAVPADVSRVVLVGPAHRVAFDGVSAGDFAHYVTPLGALAVDREAIADLESRSLVTCVPEAHAAEHCLEVIVPFLQVVCGDLEILPLLVGRAGPEAVDAVLEAALAPGDLLVVSSDLSHGLGYDEACARDRRTLEAVACGEWRHLSGHDACGHKGLGAAMRLAARRGWRPDLLDYRNSGDTAGSRAAGDYIVGYGAACWTA